MAKASQGKFNVLKQICEHIPGHLVNKAAQNMELLNDLAHLVRGAILCL